MTPAPTYTYDVNFLHDDPVYATRFWLRDVGENNVWHFSDQEIEFVLGLYDNDSCRTAVTLVRQNAPRLNSLYGGSRSIGDLSVSRSDVASDALAYAANLELMCTATNQVAVAIAAEALNVAPIFDKAQHDSPRAGPQGRRPYYSPELNGL